MKSPSIKISDLSWSLIGFMNRFSDGTWMPPDDHWTANPIPVPQFTPEFFQDHSLRNVKYVVEGSALDQEMYKAQ